MLYTMYTTDIYYVFIDYFYGDLTNKNDSTMRISWNTKNIRSHPWLENPWKLIELNGVTVPGLVMTNIAMV